MNAVKLCKCRIISRSEQVDAFGEVPSQPAGAEHCCSTGCSPTNCVMGVEGVWPFRRTAGSVKCNETLIKIRSVLCQVLYKHVRR